MSPLCPAALQTGFLKGHGGRRAPTVKRPASRPYWAPPAPKAKLSPTTIRRSLRSPAQVKALENAHYSDMLIAHMGNSRQTRGVCALQRR